MSDLPIPPNVPESVAVAIIDNFNLINGEDEFRCGEYFTAAAYAQLWRDKANSYTHRDDPENTWSSIATENSKICAARMRELSK